MTIRIRTIELDSIGPQERSELVTRSAVPDGDVLSRAAAIVREVRKGGDETLRALNTKHGGGSTKGALRVDESMIREAFNAAVPELVEALQNAIRQSGEHTRLSYPLTRRSRSPRARD